MSLEMKSPVRTLRSFLLLLSALLLTGVAYNAHAQGNCGAYAGFVTVNVGPVCLVQGHAQITGTPSNDAVVPTGFTSLYILSRTNGLIVEQMGPTPVFTVGSVDVWRIHRLVYAPGTVDLGNVLLGQTSAFDLQALITQGGGEACGSLSMANTAVKTMECDKPCGAHAAGMYIDSTTVCLQNNQATLTASVNGGTVLPPGFQQRFLLTRTNGLILEQIASTPSFTVTSVDVWRIHQLIYDPASLDLGFIQFGSTSAYDLQSHLVQGGGPVCGSLDISGAPVKTGICTQACTAAAGTVGANLADLCLNKGIAILDATPNGSAQVPAGFALVYLLSEGSGPETILAHSSTPHFTVSAAGSYRIHPFVYNPSTFNLTSIVLGTTTLASIDEQLIQGEGDICAALDLGGAYFQVADCTPSCLADAGTLTSENNLVCLASGTATVAASLNGDNQLPTGFVEGYWLSTGTDQWLIDFSPTPLFMVQDTGTYRIHAFAYNPSSFNPSAQTGTTTAYQLNSMLVQGGGAICAGFDLLGAPISVMLCPPPCTAGTDSSTTVCFSTPPFNLFPLLGGNPCPGGTWTNPAGPQVNGTFNPATDPAGMYFYTSMTPAGPDTATVTITVVECPEFAAFSTVNSEGGHQGGTTGVSCPPDLNLPTVSRIWPNPSNDIVNVDVLFKVGPSTTAELLDATGRLVKGTLILRQANTIALDVSRLTPGIWTVLVRDGNHLAVGRFMCIAPE